MIPQLITPQGLFSLRGSLGKSRQGRLFHPKVTLSIIYPPLERFSSPQLKRHKNSRHNFLKHLTPFFRRKVKGFSDSNHLLRHGYEQVFSEELKIFPFIISSRPSVSSLSKAEDAFSFVSIYFFLPAYYYFTSLTSYKHPGKKREIFIL